MSNEIIPSQIVDLNAFNNQDTGFSVGDFKQIVYRRWKPALAVGVAAFAGIFLFTVLKTPEYRSESLILLESEQNKQSASVDPVQTMTSQYYSVKDLSTEIFILRSNSMVDRAVKKLKTRYPDLSAGEVVGKLSIYQAIVDNKIPTDVLVVSYTDADPEKAKTILDTLSIYLRRLQLGKTKITGN